MLRCCIEKNNIEYYNWRVKYKARTLKSNLEFWQGWNAIVNTMLRLHDATKQIEARYNSHIYAHNGYQASLDRTGRRGRPAFIITAEQLTFLLEQGFTVPVISVMLGVGKRTVERRMSELNFKVSGKCN